MKFAISALAVFLAVASVNVARADEGITQIAASKAVKQELVSSLQAQLARHENMTQEQIVVDLQATTAKNREVMLKVPGISGAQMAVFDQNAENTLNAVRSLDKDGILALETARLQQAMTSANFMFSFTRWNMQYVSSSESGESLDGSNVGYDALTIFCTPFALALDIALLPFEVVVSAATGF